MVDSPVMKTEIYRVEYIGLYRVEFSLFTLCDDILAICCQWSVSGLKCDNQTIYKLL